ncbi:GNAT family N-acetyltransferase [Pseudoalteromonas phenolica]|uniref:GNAT family N-acetyltransferase n=1 Tax=Pseudoalteromonas phenolica TaxID=161398 RepID=A0A5R9Q247_9GAMM|nr:GNAT family N-acetyltransferase [Pseudoalteromonas phenolica]TLX46457.1 GNAT family N-acetyltransferase [Pseudoalteromonas phenolica]
MVYHVTKVNWFEHQTLLTELREKVFVYELNLPKKVEFDSLDKKSEHAIIYDDCDTPVGTGRLCPNGLISRVAIISQHRNKDAFYSILNYLVVIAKEKGLNNIFINSVLDEVPAFVEYGFSKKGGVFMEAGIPRQQLYCPVNDFNAEPFTMLH